MCNCAYSCLIWFSTRSSMVLPGTGWDVIGEDAAAGGVAGAGDCVACANAAAGSANSAMMAAEAKWLDRIVFIVSFLGLTLSAIWKGVVGAPAGRLARVGKPVSSRNKRAVAVRSNRLAATRNRPAAAEARNTPARRSRHQGPGR